MKEKIKLTLKSVKYKINANRRKYCFELFGYDFIIDANFYVKKKYYYLMIFLRFG